MTALARILRDMLRQALAQKPLDPPPVVLDMSTYVDGTYTKRRRERAVLLRSKPTRPQ